MQRKTLMVLGAGVFQIPAIEAGKRLGYRTLAVSYYPNDPGGKVADELIVCSTVDKEEVLRHARERKIDGVMTMASEVSAVTAAYVAEALGLTGYTEERARSIGNKIRLRELMRVHGFPEPGFFGVRSFEEARARFEQLRKPVFLKPAAASGSRGVSKLYTLEDLERCFAQSLAASILSEEAILEEELSGREIGGEVLVKGGRIVFFQPTRKLLNAHFVPYGHILPADLPDEQFEAVKAKMAALVKALELQDGPLNFDIMLTAEGPRLIELGGRLGGNCLPLLMRLHTGVDTVEAVVRLAMGQPYDLPAASSEPVGAFIFGAARDGVARRVFRLGEKFPQWADDLIETRTRVEAGQQVQEFTQGDRQLGYFILRGRSGQELHERIAAMQEETWVEVE